MPSNRLLIADDAPIMRARIRNIAHEAGWEVVGEPTNGEEAIAGYKKHRPDLVTMDVVMPNVDGVAALKSIVAFDSNAKVVMVSAIDQKEKLTECIESGATDFIVKPFDKERLRAFLEKHYRPDKAQRGVVR